MCLAQSHNFFSVQFSHSVVSDSLRPHESQHSRPPCPSPSPGVHSDSCPLSHWCHPAISSSVVPFCSCLQSLRASESFPVSHLFSWGGQSTGVSALASFLPKKSQGWSPSEWTGWISLHSKGLSRVFSNTTVQKCLPFTQVILTDCLKRQCLNFLLCAIGYLVADVIIRGVKVLWMIFSVMIIVAKDIINLTFLWRTDALKYSLSSIASGFSRLHLFTVLD